MPPLLTRCVAERAEAAPVSLAAIPPAMQQAVLAIEDRRFYWHPGVIPISIVGAVIINLLRRQTYLFGGSTHHTAARAHFFLTDEFNAERAAAALAAAQGARAVHVARARDAGSKDEILELYLNDVYLGQRGSFAIHGVAEARACSSARTSRTSPSTKRPDRRRHPVPAGTRRSRNPKDAVERRNVVLHAMADEDTSPQRRAKRASREPLAVVAARARNEAPYFVDYVGQELAENSPGLTATTSRGRRPHDARPESAAPRAGRRARRPGEGRPAARRSASARGARRRR